MLGHRFDLLYLGIHALSREWKRDFGREMDDGRDVSREIEDCKSKVWDVRNSQITE